jgi:hypothetical protein
MNEAVTLAMRPAPGGQATDRRALDGVGFTIMPDEFMVLLCLNGVIHEAFTKLTLAADR